MSGNENITGTLTVNGATTINALLDASGIHVKNRLDVSGNENVTGTLTVNGATTINALLDASAVKVRNNLDVSGNTSITGTLTGNSATTINALLDASAVKVRNNLDVSGNTSITGTLTGNSATTINALLDASAVKVRNNLDVSGNTSITGTLQMNSSKILFGTTNHRIAMGNVASSALNNTIVLNASAVDISSANASAFYVKPIRDSSAATITKRLTYHSTNYEITQEDNTLALLRDVSGASSATTGMGLIYNTGNSRWEARQRDYYLLTINGDLSNNSTGVSLPAGAQINPFIIDTSAVWVSYDKTADFSNNITFTPSNGRFTFSTSSTNRLYKVSGKIHINLNSFGTGDSNITLAIYSDLSSSPIVKNQIRYPVTDIPSIVISDCYVRNVTYIYMIYTISAGTQNFNGTFYEGIATMDIIEV